MRMIDADALIKEAGKLWATMPDGEELSKELMKAINHAPTVAKDINVPGWISVKDRLPCEYPWEAKWVLVWFGEASKLRTEAPLPAKWNPVDRTWWIVGFTDKYEQYKLKVTHWMPLPEPPKEGDDG